MKALRLILVPVVALLTLCSCEEERASYLPDSHWILKVDGMTEGHRLALTFSGDEMEVRDGSSTDTPPLTSGVWSYHIDADGMLHMSRTVYDGDGSSTESYVLQSVTDAELTRLTLTYDPWLGSPRTYRFERR